MLPYILAKKIHVLSPYVHRSIAWMRKKTYTFVKSKDAFKGQGLVEYALILVLVALVVIVVLALLGPAIYKIFDTIGCAMDYPTEITTRCYIVDEQPPE